jgi:hypothetical protein
MRTGPVAAYAAGTVAVAWATPLTYSFQVLAVLLYTPTRWVHTSGVKSAADWE